jgi:hypothetical protein
MKAETLAFLRELEARTIEDERRRHAEFVSTWGVDPEKERTVDG